MLFLTINALLLLIITAGVQYSYDIISQYNFLIISLLLLDYVFVLLRINDFIINPLSRIQLTIKKKMTISLIAQNGYYVGDIKTLVTKKSRRGYNNIGINRM